MAEEPLLNSIDRFRKRPERIVLEEHGHCEIPAGCGGVVLRWRNPQTAVPVTIHLYTPAKIACFIDGAPLQTGRIDLAPGMASAYNGLGAALAARGDLEGAVASYRQALELEPGWSLAKANLDTVLHRTQGKR